LYRKFPLARFQRRAGTTVNILIAGLAALEQHSIEWRGAFAMRMCWHRSELEQPCLCQAKIAGVGVTISNMVKPDIIELGALGRNFDS